jgi:hypothetical protein
MTIAGIAALHITNSVFLRLRRASRCSLVTVLQGFPDALPSIAAVTIEGSALLHERPATVLATPSRA